MQSNCPPSLFKAHEEDTSDPEFDNIFNDVISSESSSSSKSSSSLPKGSKKAKTSSLAKSTVENKSNQKPNLSNLNQASYQGLLVTCTNETVAARTVQLMNVKHDEDKCESNTVVTAIGQPIVVAEELGEVTAINLSSNGEWLALALSCFQIWIIQLSWKSVKQTKAASPNNRLPKIISAVRHLATLEGHRSLIHGLHFLKGAQSNFSTPILCILSLFDGYD